MASPKVVRPERLRILYFQAPEDAAQLAPRVGHVEAGEGGSARRLLREPTAQHVDRTCRPVVSAPTLPDNSASRRPVLATCKKEHKLGLPGDDSRVRLPDVGLWRVGVGASSTARLRPGEPASERTVITGMASVGTLSRNAYAKRNSMATRRSTGMRLLRSTMRSTMSKRRNSFARGTKRWRALTAARPLRTSAEENAAGSTPRRGRKREPGAGRARIAASVPRTRQHVRTCDK